MKARTITLHRNELYKQVWEEPLTRLAKEYGISDVALKKICRKLKVPTPPLGYWAKRLYRKRVPRKPPLPKLKVGEPSSHNLHIQKPKKEVEDLDPEVKELIAAEMRRAKPITIPRKLRAPHKLVEEAREILTGLKPDDYGVLRPHNKKYLDIRVAPANLVRALRIMNVLIKSLELRGFQVENEVYRSTRTYVSILGGKIYFRLHEKIQRLDHVPTAAEKRELARYNHSFMPRYDFLPTGKLTLQIDEYGKYGFRKTWSDTNHQQVEETLNDFIIAAIKIAGLSGNKDLSGRSTIDNWKGSANDETS